jgi:hypothetical protein
MITTNPIFCHADSSKAQRDNRNVEAPNRAEGRSHGLCPAGVKHDAFYHNTVSCLSLTMDQNQQKLI